MARGSPKTIGVLGGITAASTKQYYATLIGIHHEVHDGAGAPEIVVVSLDFKHFTALKNAVDIGPYVAYIAEGINRPQNAGANFAFMAANSPHTVLDAVREHTTLPILSIVDVTVAEATRLGLGNVLLLGIAHTVNSPMYPQAFAERDIYVVVPGEADKRAVDDIVSTNWSTMTNRSCRSLTR